MLIRKISKGKLHKVFISQSFACGVIIPRRRFLKRYLNPSKSENYKLKSINEKL